MYLLRTPERLLNKSYIALTSINLCHLYGKPHHSILLELSLRPEVFRGLCSLSLKCWKCGAERGASNVFCRQCNILQKPDPKCNYFDVFEIRKTYELSPSELSSKYRKLQNVLHPDRFSNSSEEEQSISEDCSSFVNKAYTTLLEPLTRGLYMLELEGIGLVENNIQSDPTFLMELMERNEEVDQASSGVEVTTLNNKNRDMLEELTRKIAEAFKNGNLKEAQKNLIKMKYYSSIDTKIKVLKQSKGFLD